LAVCGLPAARGEDPVPLAVRAGSCEAVLDTADPGAQFYLIVGSLAGEPGPFRVAVRTEATADPVAVPAAPPARSPAEAATRHDLAQRLERARGQRPPQAQYPPLPAPPPQRVFYLFTGDQDFHDAAAYTAVVGELRAVGRHCQVYVDRAHADPRALQPTIDDAVRTFDEQVYPVAQRRLGQALDVDRDGRFTILFTGLLDRLQRGTVSLGGFVRGSDFFRDQAAPFGNRCDVMYLNTNLKPGPHLRTVLAHEYTHAVVFSEHVFGDYLPVASRQDEESWLNEALAHVVEELHGLSWTNLDYRVSAFLSAPERYRLVVGDYYASRVWRDPGTRGAAYLFLRWCRARCGDELLPRLARSNLRGVLNLEVATQRPFPELFRAWSAAVLLGEAGAPGPDLRRPLGSRLLCGPRFADVPLHGGRHELRLAGTGAGYVLLHSPAGARSRVTVTADPRAELQVSLVRVPPGAARLSLRCAAAADGSSVRLGVTAHGGAVKLEGAAWERLVPCGEPERDTSYRPGQDASAWFGAADLQAGETRWSEAIPVPGAEAGRGPLVFRVAGTDARGNRVATWAAQEANANR
jgi:hypothetical protein